MISNIPCQNLPRQSLQPNKARIATFKAGAPSWRGGIERRSSSSLPLLLPHRRRVPLVRAQSDDAQPDFIEGLVGRLFGKKALEDPTPGGLKRMTLEEQPEIYKATTDVFAALLESDEGLVRVIRPLLARTQLEKTPLRLAYDANRDGWTGKAFHAKVDSFGAAVVLAKTERGAWIGGYNPKGWIGLGEERDTVAAFLFTWPDGDETARPIKLPKAGGPSIAVVDKPNEGMFFGPEGLHIPLSASDPKAAKTRLGSYYENMPGGVRFLFEGEVRKRVCWTQLVELYVFVAVGDGEKWDLDGIIWKTK